MKRTVIYVLILALLPLAPVKRADVAQLQPVEAIWLYKADGRVVICTDTFDTGEGDTALQAVEQLHRSTPALVYLDTADYLIVAEEARQDAAQLQGVLKTGVGVCLSRSEPDLETVARYLDIHGRLPSLEQWLNGEEPPLLLAEKGQIKLLENYVK